MPTEIIGRYEVGSVIGRGAMAVVYKAVDPTIGRSIALKTMRFDVHSIEKQEVLSRFRNEARAAGKLLHPNLVTIYDAGEQDGTFYIAMEYVEGKTLQAVLAEEHFLTLDQTIDILTQICAGLDYAHANGVIHRDIKPANIMIAPNGVVKITDFGIAKAGAQLTSGGDILGTPNYISPEMVKGEPVDGRSDLFSVAIILYEMLLGERPFAASNISTIIYKVVNEPLPAELETRVHPAVAAILRKALAKHPSDRYQTGLDLVGALKSYQALLTQEIPSTVIPGTPIVTSFPVASSGAAVAMAPIARSGDATPTPTLAFQPPPVFGSDVPPAFLGMTEAPEEPTGAFKTPPAPAAITMAPPPPPADPVPAAMRAAAPVNPPTVKTVMLAHRAIPKAPQAANMKLRRILSVAAITLGIIAVILVAAKGISLRRSAEEPKPEAAVEERDPYAIPQTESKQATETTTKKDRSDDIDVVVHKKTAKAAPLAIAAAPVVATPEPMVAFVDLAVSSEPAGASVQIDGELRHEKTPFKAALKPGVHTILLSKPGYVPQSHSVNLVLGAAANVSATLAAEVTAISFESTPPGASISVDELPTGQVTPATVKVEPGSHEVSLAKQGFDEATGTVRIDQGDTQHFSVVMPPSDRQGHIRTMFAGNKDRAMIIVRTRPRGAHITLDDNTLDTVTPTRIIAHKGKVHLTIQMPGYALYKTDLQLDKGEIVVVNALLQPNAK